MGKKPSEASSKTSKKEPKQQINNWIKVMRPKVYITDTSSFKRLVQQLTGNGTTTTTTTTTSQTIADEEKISTVTSSSSTATDPDKNNLESTSLLLDCNQLFYKRFIYLDDDDDLWMNQQQHKQQQQGHEILDQSALLLPLPDIDHQYLNFNGCCSQNDYQEDVSIYDYELSGIF